MKLIRADGHPQQQWALKQEQTEKIAHILHEHMNDPVLLRTVTEALRNHTGEMHEGIDRDLDHIRDLYKQEGAAYPIPVPEYIDELMQAIHALYYQPRHALYKRLEDQINSLRGAVVERLGLKLIKARYRRDDECANSRRFVDRLNRKITLQEVDIAALSTAYRQVEGYECKIKAPSLENHDCLELEYLHEAATSEDYRANVGVISFDPARYIKSRLRWLDAAACIQAYGVDTLGELQDSPFE